METKTETKYVAIKTEMKLKYMERKLTRNLTNENYIFLVYFLLLKSPYMYAIYCLVGYRIVPLPIIDPCSTI